MRAGLCEEALRLGRMLVQLLFRRRVRRSRTSGSDGTECVSHCGPAGKKREGGLAAGSGSLFVGRRADSAGNGVARIRAKARRRSRILCLQAAIVACHMRARPSEETDWERIVVLYDALMQTAPSPIVSLNRAVATVSMARGPAAGLDALDAIAALAGDSALA